MKIKKNDNVKIISGKDRGKKGKITNVFPIENKVVVEGVNVRKKHSRPKKQGQKGQIVQIAMPINASNVIIICPRCNKTVRISRKKVGANKIRTCKKCNAEL